MPRTISVGLRNILGHNILADLPKRVREIVEKEDRTSERLIGWTQLAIGCVLLVLYLIAPRPADAPMSMHSPVSLALSAYITFSLLRIWLINRNKTPDWFVALSIIADIGIVIALIWSFHIEYRQPPGFALKAPTFVYLLVLIVLRALRFEPRYVLAAGLAGALGWGILTFIAVSMSDEGAITRNYSDYINGSRILIGAEFDKIFAILMVTCLLAVSSRRAQRTLVAAIREEAAAREIGRFLSKGVADQIAKSEEIIEAGHAAERQAAIMMIDIRGFTPFAMSVPPQKVVQILTALHSRIIPIVRANHGVIDKFLGDGVMVTFGATTPHPASTANAMRALDQILAMAQDWQSSLPSLGISTPLRINAAVASGTVVFATLGGGDRLEYTVIGEAANLAAKLEKHNKSESSVALVPADSFARAIGEGYQPDGLFELRRSCNVQGVSGPLDLYVRAA
jgi:adenylate cyclase